MKNQIVEKLLKIINQFPPFHDGIDLYWIFYIRVKRSWKKIFIQKYLDTYYFSATDRISFSYPKEFSHEYLEDELKIWIEELLAYRACVIKNPIKEQARLLQIIPINLRMGLMTRRNVRRLMPDWAEINLGVTSAERKILMDILRGRDGDHLNSFTAEKYFEYCKVAYLANPKTFHDFYFKKGESGREYYKKFADGRDAGLSSLDLTSEKAFQKWYESGAKFGSHPWEIYRGGNSTHINLSVFPGYKEGEWKIVLSAFSTTRMVETCRIAIALKKATCLLHYLTKNHISIVF
ncbi:MAG: hypothetical protein KR126chlam4_01259 [Candidatus Anoxychlamydiales bacterium]|nr:hypothetical protein [Candidatus Anoxychlamydiales bacterium]NGX41418.1 hypothetical protein [Candidatus Anoxychlamydiales bacterium]